jgi:hypothetical protein
VALPPLAPFLAHAANLICFTRGRIRFESPTGELASPTQGQAFCQLRGGERGLYAFRNANSFADWRKADRGTNGFPYRSAVALVIFKKADAERGDARSSKAKTDNSSVRRVTQRRKRRR